MSNWIKPTIFLLIIPLIALTQSSQVSLMEIGTSTIEDNTIIANYPISILIPQDGRLGTDKNYVLSPIIDTYSVFEPKYVLDTNFDENSLTEAISCLVECESGNNPGAVGDNGKANGILQFHFPTFKHFCVDKYGYLENKYKDTDTQVKCCVDMLKDGLASHWTCSKTCSIK